MKFLKPFIIHIYKSWERDINKKALNFHEKNKEAVILDLGCGNGRNTLRFVKQIKSKRKAFGIETMTSAIQEARKKGINCYKGNLEKKLPFKDATFDVVISHFVSEHLLNIDGFFSEIYRVLKPSGYAVVATDNLSSWAEIGALTLGFQPFTLTHGVTDKVLGNPLAYHHGEQCGLSTHKRKYQRKGIIPAGVHGHIRVLAYKALKELIKHKNFIIENLTGAGYLLFGGRIASLLSRVDPRHAHFIVIKIRKPTKPQ